MVINGESAANESPTQPVILNACLSYMRFNMVSRDKLYIQDATCARFDLPSLKIAHEVITKFCDSDKKSKYRGPNNVSPRDKAAHCFDEIYKILANLDRECLTPSIACPSEELHKLLEMNGHWDHKVIEDRFQKIEGEVSYIRGMERALEDIKCTVLAMMTNKSLPAATVLPPPSNERLQSEILVRESHHDNNLTPKVRSESVVSYKRFRQEDDDVSDSDLEFLQPKYNLKKAEKRQKRSPDNKILNKVSSSSTVPKAIG